MIFLYAVELDQLYNISKFHQILFSGLLIIMGKKTMVWSLRYDPTQRRFFYIFSADGQPLC